MRPRHPLRTHAGATARGGSAPAGPSARRGSRQRRSSSSPSRARWRSSPRPRARSPRAPSSRRRPRSGARSSSPASRASRPRPAPTGSRSPSPACPSRAACPRWPRPPRRSRTAWSASRVPVSEIFAAAQSLEEAYAQAGYVLARVVIPQQSLRERRAAAARRGQRLHRAPRHRRRSRAGARADRPRRRAPRRPAQPQARRDRAPAADRGRHLWRRAPLRSVARRRSGRRGPRGRGGLPSRHRLDRDRQHPIRPARHLDARDRRRDQQRLQARRDDLLPRLGLSREATARVASAASSPAIRAPAPSRRARSSRSARKGSPSTSRRPAARRRPSPPTASRPGPSSSASPSAPSTR